MEAGANIENTSVIRRLSDFDNFLARNSRNRNLLGLDGGVNKRLWFHDSSIDRSTIGTPSVSGITTSTPASSTYSRQPVNPAEREMHMATALKRQREADLIVANSQITNLESKLADQETNNKRAKLDYDKQEQEIKLELQMAKIKEDNAQQQLLRIHEKELDCRKQLAELRVEYGAAKCAYEKKLNSLEKEKTNLKSSLESQVSALQQETFELKNELESEMAESRYLQIELGTVHENLKSCNRELDELKLLTQKLEASCADDQKKQEQIEELTRKLSNIEDSAVLVPILNGEIAKLKAFGEENLVLIEENRILRLRDENILLLKEQLDGSQKLNELQVKQCSDLPRLQLEHDELKRQLSSWDALAIIIPDKELGSRPKAVMREIARLQQQEALLLEKVGSLTTENRALAKTGEELEEELLKVKEQERRGEVSLKHSADITRHLRRKLLLVAKERDMSRALLDNYEKETTVVGVQQEGERLARMESLLEGYKRDIESLEKELRDTREHLQSFGHQQGYEIIKERDLLEAKSKQLQTHNANLELLVNRLKEEKQVAEMKLFAATNEEGADAQKIHLVSNPVQWMRQAREQHFESITKQNEALKQRVKVLEEAEGRVADLTLQVEERLKEAPTSKDVQDLQTKLTAAETKLVRQIEVFKTVSTEFREVTKTLLGYSISLPCTNQYKLCNTYADSQDDYLLFSKSESGEVQLLETPYSLTISENIETFLHTHHSIPAFLSNLTMELFRSHISVLVADVTEAESVTD